MQLEQLKAENIPLVACWNVELHEDEGSTPMTLESAEIRLRKWLTNDSFQILIVTVADQPIGYLLYQVVPATPDIRGSVESIYVRQFYIVRNARRCGHGKKAIEQFTQQVLNDTHPLRLDVKVSNPAGRKFWESLGFVAEHVAYSRDSLRSRSTV